MNLNHYIAFEGVEGAGKSVVSAEIVKILESPPYNLDVVCVREPGGTKIGEEIRRVLLNER